MAVDIEIRDDVLCVTLSGTVTRADLMRVGFAMAKVEDDYVIAPPRISDFSVVETIEVGFDEMLALAEHRRQSNLRNPVRSAIVVANAVQRGMARMFQTLHDHPLVTLEIFDDYSAAMAWLLADRR